MFQETGDGRGGEDMGVRQVGGEVDTTGETRSLCLSCVKGGRPYEKGGVGSMSVPSERVKETETSL